MLPDESLRRGVVARLVLLWSSAVAAAGCSGGGSTEPGPGAPDPLPPDEGSVTLQWTRPQTNEDGSPLTDLAGYRIYYGESPSALHRTIDLPDPASSRLEIQALHPGTWHFAVTAYNEAGIESRKSRSVSTTVQS